MIPTILALSALAFVALWALVEHAAPASEPAAFVVAMTMAALMCLALPAALVVLVLLAWLAWGGFRG